MTTYVALLRGIMPMNPNMRNAKICAVFEGLGFKNVKAVIASGNIIFETTSKSIPNLESKIEKALEAQLGFFSTTIVRSKEELKTLVKKNPFKGVKDEKPNYLVVSFLKEDRGEIATVLNLDKGSTPDFMRDIEKKYNKQVTTRTWKTVGRILAKMTL